MSLSLSKIGQIRVFATVCTIRFDNTDHWLMCSMGGIVACFHRDIDWWHFCCSIKPEIFVYLVNVSWVRCSTLNWMGGARPVFLIRSPPQLGARQLLHNQIQLQHFSKQLAAWPNIYYSSFAISLHDALDRANTLSHEPDYTSSLYPRSHTKYCIF